MTIRIMLTIYVVMAIAAAFYIGNHTYFYSDGILLDTPHVTYWYDFDGVAQ